MVSRTRPVKFTLMEDRSRFDLMHESCGRLADPPLVRGTSGWRAVGTVTDIPELRQRDIECAWCYASLIQSPHEPPARLSCQYLIRY